MSLDGLSSMPLVTELNRLLAGGRIDKIFQIDKYILWLWIHQPGIKHRLIISVNPENPAVFISETMLETPDSPSGFTMLLRKHIEDGRIAQIVQYGLDRIISIAIDVRGERGTIVTKSLNIELMGKHSNIILTEDNTVIDAIRRIGSNISRYRQVLPNHPYILPPGQARLNILSTPAADFAAAVQKTTGTLSKGLVNTGEGVGPISAKEIAWRAGLPPDMAAADMNATDIAALAEAIASITTPLNNEICQPTVAVSSTGQLMGIAAFNLGHLHGTQLHTFANMSAAVEYANQLKGVKQDSSRQQLLKLVTNEIAKLERKQLALNEELTNAEAATDWREFADVLMANLYAVPPGTAAIELPNYYAENGNTTLTIPLDPDKTPVENAQTYYAKYNKLKRARYAVAEQLQQCTAEIKYLESVGCALELTSVKADVAEIREELITAGYIQVKKKRQPPAARTQFLTATTPDGTNVLIGKNNRQNDLLTFKKAHADDIWLHTKDIPGSHVILQTGTTEPTATALTAAAQLAAYFSKAQHSSSVPIDYTRRRYVKKPSGAKPGFVTYDKQRTIYVTPDAEVIAKLLKNQPTSK